MDKKDDGKWFEENLGRIAAAVINAEKESCLWWDETAKDRMVASAVSLTAKLQSCVDKWKDICEPADASPISTREPL